MRTPLAHRAALSAALVALVASQGCTEDRKAPLRAFQATAPEQLIGGDVAMTRVGDFILENDQIRLGILGHQSSPGPGVFGGTLVDADLVRPDARFRGGRGHDQFAEMFPFANLLVPRPEETRIEILEDGSDGERAVLRVTADGSFFLEALSILQDPLLSLLFPNVKLHLEVQTDYILEPGKRYVRMVSVARRISAPGDDGSCPALDCDLTCPGGYAWDTQGCQVCACAPEAPTELPHFTDSTPIFMQLLGDPAADLAPGVVAGDFVFFGGQNDIFAPGIGFDEDKAVFDALFEGRDTFTYPLPFDFMAAAGGAVSYGYFTAAPRPPQGQGAGANAPNQPQVLVPIITSSATAFVTSGTSCSASDGDDSPCTQQGQWSWERYFVVGKGDIASIADVMFEVRGTPVGRLSGVVTNAAGSPEKNGRVFVFRDPDPTRDFADTFEIADANRRATGNVGLLNVIDADVGLDMVEDGDFSATMPKGSYLVVATNDAQTVTSPVQRVTVEVGQTTRLAPRLPAPARVRFVVLDQGGARLPAKLSFLPVLADGTLATRDGLRRPYMGEGRLGNGIRHLETTLDGQGEVEIEPGRYQLVVSRGPEYSVARIDVEAVSGRVQTVEAVLRREVDTGGWISGDFHLHAEPSFDSGLKLATRVTNAIVEGLELAVATDHDVVTDYAPTVRDLRAEQWLKTAIGVELSTLELGHFIAFPLSYDRNLIPDNGAPDWSCKDGPALMDELDEHIRADADGVKIMAHPRDGFIGYISQLGVNPFDLTRTPDFLEAGNVLLSRSTCDFDAMEVFNSKRFDLVRQATNREVILYNRCNDRLDAAESVMALDSACPELTGDDPLASCPEGEIFFECKQRYRRRLAFLTAREILIRTPEEHAAYWEHQAGGAADESACDPSQHTGDIPAEIADKPCVHHPGTYDDWMKWLDLGLNVTITAASDSHGFEREPGLPRTYVKSEAPTPQQIEPTQVARALVDGQALPTFGPFVEVTVAGKGPGETASVAAGEPMDVHVKVQTASWFGVDRVEVYVSGQLVHVAELDHGPEVIVDFDQTVTVPAPDADGFVSVIALGTREDLLMDPVYLEVAFGELQLPRVASLAFSAIEAFALFFSPSPIVPDFFPIFPMAATNAVLLDVDGDGVWSRPGPLPAFCPSACDPDDDTIPANARCPKGQTCLPRLDGQGHECAVKIEGECLTAPPGATSAIQALSE